MSDFYTPKQNHYLFQLALLTFPLPDDLPEGDDVPGPWDDEEAYDKWTIAWNLDSKEARKHKRRREGMVLIRNHV